MDMIKLGVHKLGAIPPTISKNEVIRMKNKKMGHKPFHRARLPLLKA